MPTTRSTLHRFGGDDPEKNYKEHQRNLQLWLVEAEARLPPGLIGKRIIDSVPLCSRLSALLAHLTVDEITSDTGHRQIVTMIESAHEYLKDHRLEQAFEDAIFRGKRDRGMSLTMFMTNKKAAFAELRKQGLDLLATAAGRHLLGHLILRQGGFSQDQKQRLKVVTNGSIDFREVETAIQKVFGDRLDDQQHEQYGQQRRWRSATYFDDDGYEHEYEENAIMDDDIPDIDLFEDLICLNEDGSEAQMIYHQELPVILDEQEAVETVCDNLEEIFYEAHQRLHQHGRGKRKGKKGKGGKFKGASKTYGMNTPSFGRGGYLEHRRLRQATRNGRGYERPWQQRSGSRLSLSEIKSKTRCHRCKQIGHWSKECPQRTTSGKPGASATGTTAGFFMTPPATSWSGQFLTVTNDDQDCEQYMERFTALSFVFHGAVANEGVALVDTAAQHGLIGANTLQRHDRLLQDRFGIRVQWTNEHGGSVRGVCGQEETTRICYIPIGLGGKSGVLRVQVVPGDIPMLLPAYLLTDLEAVIDMKNCMIMFLKIGVSLKMTRQSTGHVSIGVCELVSMVSTCPPTTHFVAVKRGHWRPLGCAF